MAAIPDYEQAGELKIGQVGIANLRIRRLDIERIVEEMAERVRTAPKLFQRAAVILDFGGLSECPTGDAVRALVTGLRAAGALPVGIAYGTSAIEALSREVDLPLLAKFRVSYESAEARSTAAAASIAGAGNGAAANPASAQQAAARGGKARGAAAAMAGAAGTAAAETPAAVPAQPAVEPGLMQLAPVRSGQQLYARNRDLTVCATVGAGAEVIADGSIHIYGALRGRALAGASGAPGARIFCREFHAELVAVAGTYRVLEEVPKDLIGKPVQIWLDNDSLRIEALA